MAIRIYLKKVKLELFMVEKGIEVRVCSTIYRYVKASNKYMKDYNNNKESSYLSIRM